MSARRRRRHWYRLHFYVCPVCGDGEGEAHRERIYSSRPPARWSTARAVYHGPRLGHWCGG